MNYNNTDSFGMLLGFCNEIFPSSETDSEDKSISRRTRSSKRLRSTSTSVAAPPTPPLRPASPYLSYPGIYTADDTTEPSNSSFNPNNPALGSSNPSTHTFDEGSEYSNDSRSPIPKLKATKSHRLTSCTRRADGPRRGPINSGARININRPHPELIPAFSPQPYTGPAAAVKYTESALNTRGNIVHYSVYETILDMHPEFVSRNHISYDTRGHLSPHVLFDRGSFSAFIAYHPLGRNLWFRLEKLPAYCRLFPAAHPAYAQCRARNCLKATATKGVRGFKDGSIRVAIEEVLGRIQRKDRFKNNPYFCAGYFHVDCFEDLVDIGQLISFGMFRPKPREHHPLDPPTSKTEPHQLCTLAKVECCFEEFSRKIVQKQWTGYRTNLADRLQCYIWLCGQRKQRASIQDRPVGMNEEQATFLLENRPVDPRWGGGRRPNLTVKTVKKAEALGKISELIGPGHGRRSALSQEKADIVKKQIDGSGPNENEFEDGMAWLNDCLMVPIMDLNEKLQQGSVLSGDSPEYISHNDPGAKKRKKSKTPSRSARELTLSLRAHSRSRRDQSNEIQTSHFSPRNRDIGQSHTFTKSIQQKKTYSPILLHPDPNTPRDVSNFSQLSPTMPFSFDYELPVHTASGIDPYLLQLPHPQPSPSRHSSEYPTQKPGSILQQQQEHLLQENTCELQKYHEHPLQEEQHASQNCQDCLARHSEGNAYASQHYQEHSLQQADKNHQQSAYTNRNQAIQNSWDWLPPTPTPYQTDWDVNDPDLVY
jgi:hypothetical protein